MMVLLKSDKICSLKTYGFIIFYFKVCVTAAGRNDRNSKEFATVDWMAYQGAPDGGLAGKTRIPQWWTGSKCEEITLPYVSAHLLIIAFFVGNFFTQLFIYAFISLLFI